jgi:hypothetical protein
MNSSKRTATTFAHIHAACQHKASEKSVKSGEQLNLPLEFGSFQMFCRL